MRQIHRQIAEEALGRKVREPLAEGMDIPLKKNGQRHWTVMGDEEVIAHARRFMKESGVTSKGAFSKADPGFYEVLRERKLLGRVGFEKKRREMRDWASMGDEELVAHARQFMRERGVIGKKELEKADMGLHTALYRRGLLNKVGFESKMRERRNWASMSDEELVGYAKRLIEAGGISARKQLEKGDLGLYYALLERGLMDLVIPHKRAMRDWKKMSDAELIEYAKGFLKENEITGRAGLAYKYGNLYSVLARRKLLDRVFAEVEQKAKDEVLGQLREAVDLYTQNG